MAQRITHGACGQWWTGTRTSHCGGCHRNYAGLAAFDAHRREFRCLDPATLTRRGEFVFEAVYEPYGVLWRLHRPNPWTSPRDT